MLTPQQTAKFKELLLQQKQELEETLSNREEYERASEREASGELSLYDNHPGDMATELFEREKDLGLMEFWHKQLNDVNHALEKIENGQYGICEVSGEEIPLERLEAIPTATTCIEHTHNKLMMGARPIEEELLDPPFGKYDMDSAVGYDAEDSWQDAAWYGSSMTPSDLERRDTKDFDHMYDEGDEPRGYVEEFENFIGTDMYGKNPQVYATQSHEEYEDMLDYYEAQTFAGELGPDEYSPRP
ncbi:TraR/DksA C4-type zinc finger protein [Ectobacillus sp. JY-23]|uniref:TraR/DksA C4-type zinc finger protein n=1 Tax=Ectobacillus sp. JY-23 TaxID=2933872 RepID=UPI001FF542C5|nr:TraR/DksA C4-type zinc finger protein [Ectobacillus sp. JY-23]UOY94391.1 TraR/DksA C4-type zinc finger protein [Ectobacillus sp. JY-23]